MKLKDAIHDFLLACQAEGLSPATTRWYRSLLQTFNQALPNEELTTVNARMLRQYIVDLQQRRYRYVDAAQKPEQRGGLSEASIAGHVRALHAFWAWSADEYEISNPMRNIRRKQMPHPEPKAINPKDFVKLFEATSRDDIGKRDRALLAFLADTGCRLGGLLSLTIHNLYLEQRKAVVTEKGAKQRNVVFTTYTANLLRQWLAVRESYTDFVFVSMTAGNGLTASGVNQLLKRLKKRARVTGRVNPHSFRHNFAREYLRNGGDLATLAKLLGHADISITSNYYAIFSEDELADFHEKFSPLYNMLDHDDDLDEE